MKKSALNIFKSVCENIEKEGLTKNERIITTPQSARISTTEKNNIINLCSNNYLGFADNQDIINAAKESFDKYGYGLSSVRFICGTQDIHKKLEKTVEK